ncbi:expressed protein [Dictyostelium purpureum]|uniref:Expressed protein n=1 Tax=Dictyostelium purpureum TaxID=5786 RepID=F0ZNW7_DICPU|nr:uncharacterized protein DICPUDRAFT_92234 [Dictyostelium purpureum]EGC34381.1 expressed protein [Dictyostelium purpureum]|eukprot:XP_003289115.1 expressed protein [Dictyostelium purpureum]
MADIQQAPQVCLRVNGEIFNSVLQLGVTIHRVVCVGNVLSIKGDEVTISIPNGSELSTEFKFRKEPSCSLVANENTYQFSIKIDNQNLGDSIIEYAQDFGTNFVMYSYSTSFFNYWYILKDRYPQLKGSEETEETGEMDTQ